MAAYTVNKSLDCKGLSCPMPIVRTKKAIDQMAPGEVLEMVATDPGSVADVRSWADRTGHQFIGTQEEGGTFKHYIRKANPEEVRPEKNYPHVVQNEELSAKLSDNPYVLDVREPMEYAFGHIPGAKLVPFGQLEETVESLRQEAGDREIYIVCRTGTRSDAACLVLTEKGFANVYNVLPGMSEWNGPLEQDQK